jgi:hypothetical protein
MFGILLASMVALAELYFMAKGAEIWLLIVFRMNKPCEEMNTQHLETCLQVQNGLLCRYFTDGDKTDELLTMITT